MMTNLFLKPARDAAGAPVLVRDPVSMMPLAADGEWKTQSPYWIRRLRDRDVTDATPVLPAAAPSPAIAPQSEPAVVPSAGSSLLSLINAAG